MKQNPPLSVRVATIGTGSIVHTFLDAVAATDGIRCEAVYSRDPKKGEALAEEYQVNKVYTDLNTMTEDPDIDVIYIASPNSLHYEQAKLALNRGKHVICEKPFTPTLAKTKELTELARNKRLFLFDAVIPSFLPNYQVIKDALVKIGKLRLVMSNYSQYSSRYDALLAGNITNVFSKDFAGGCLQDIGFYNLYFNIATFGKPRAASYYANMYPGQVDTSGILVLQYDGFISSNVGAKDTWGENFVQIEGEKGYIYVEGGSNRMSAVRIVTKTGEERISLQEPVPGMNYEVQAISDLIHAGDYEECYRRLEVTADVIETLENARKAAGIYFTEE